MNLVILVFVSQGNLPGDVINIAKKVVRIYPFCDILVKSYSCEF